MWQCRCVCSFLCVCVCVKLEEGCGTAPQILWRMLQKIHSVGFLCFFFSWKDSHVLFWGVFWGGCFLSRLGHTGAACRRGTHLSENLVQPLQGTIQMQLDPARSACDSLSPVLGSPAFNKTHADGAHSGKLIDSFKTLVDRLSQQGCKFLVVKYF